MGTITNQFIEDIAWEIISDELTLPKAGEVHVWRINVTANRHRLGEFRKLLKSDEVVRGDKYYQLKDRQRFVISRGLQRIILAKYLNQQPGQLNFILGDNQKPYLSAGAGVELHYNISHSGDWIVLAVSQTPVGADVEYIDAGFPFDDILTEHFSPDEKNSINVADKINRFYLLWTRKEAFLKATGQGLGEHLRHTPSLNGAHKLQPDLYGADKDWSQQSFFIADEYMASIAAAGEWLLKTFDVNF